MKTIEERAIEWVDSQSAGSVHPYNRQAMVAAYVAVYRELTQWHDPKEVIPEQYKDVEVKDYKGRVSVCNLEVDELGRRFWNVSRTDFSILNSNIIGWREIH
jgi:hypothetical protein